MRCAKHRSFPGRHQFGRTFVRGAMLSLLPVTLSFAASGSRPGLFAPSRLGAPAMAATWSSVDGTTDRASSMAVMEELKASGDATLWNTMRLAPRSVSLRELSQMTKIDEKALQPGEEFSLEDIQVRRHQPTGGSLGHQPKGGCLQAAYRLPRGCLEEAA